MQALILAGGLGTRLRPLTDRIPKPMATVAGRPFIEHLIRMLEKSGIDEAVLATGYLGGAIRDYFTGNNGTIVKISYSEESSPLGTGGALKNAEGLLNEEFFVVNGDSYLPMDYHGMSRAFKSSNAAAMMAVSRSGPDKTDVPFNVRLDSASMVTGYCKERAGEGFMFVDAGVLLLKKDVLGMMPRSIPCSLENDIYPALIKAAELRGFQTEQPFYDIGTPERLGRFEAYLNGNL